MYKTYDITKDEILDAIKVFNKGVAADCIDDIKDILINAIGTEEERKTLNQIVCGHIPFISTLSYWDGVGDVIRDSPMLFPDIVADLENDIDFKINITDDETIIDCIYPQEITY